MKFTQKEIDYIIKNLELNISNEEDQNLYESIHNKLINKLSETTKEKPNLSEESLNFMIEFFKEVNNNTFMYDNYNSKEDYQKFDQLQEELKRFMV